MKHVGLGPTPYRFVKDQLFANFSILHWQEYE